jgi:GNAT superfamily N-acetyltransferase
LTGESQPKTSPCHSLERLRPEEIRLAKGTETTPDQRAAFFAITHPKLAPWLAPHWAWWFRIRFRPEIAPIVAIARDQVIGHAGTLPFVFRYGEEVQTAVWYLVFAVLPECQGLGLGKKMTEEWMRLSPNPITECNEKSISIFKKYGWEETFATRRLACVTAPARLAGGRPRAVQIALSLAEPLYKAWMRWSSRSAPKIEPEGIGQEPGSLSDLFRPEPDAQLELIRDETWVKWRILESPFVHEYRLFRLETAVALVRCFVSEGVRRLHILYVSASDRREQTLLLKGIVRWACDDRADLIWAVARSRTLIDTLRTSLASEIGVRIAAYNKNEQLMNSFLNPGFQLQAIDSDIDLAHAEDTGTRFLWD